jgi:hypothetical protein
MNKKNTVVRTNTSQAAIALKGYRYEKLAIFKAPTNKATMDIVAAPSLCMVIFKI